MYRISKKVINMIYLNVKKKKKMSYVFDQAINNGDIKNRPNKPIRKNILGNIAEEEKAKPPNEKNAPYPVVIRFEIQENFFCFLSLFFLFTSIHCD